MPKLQYVGTSHFRELSKKDLTDAGVPADTEGLKALNFAREDKDKSWNPKRVPHTLEVPQAVIDLLTDLEPDDWKVVGDEEEFAAADATVEPSDPAVTPNAADNPAVNVAGTDTTASPTSTGGSSTTPASGRGAR